MIGVAIIIVLVGTAHWWGPPFGRGLKRVWKNLEVAGDAVLWAAKRVFGQGQTRPTKKGESS